METQPIATNQPPLTPVGAGIIPPVQPVIPSVVEGSKPSHLLPIILSSLLTALLLISVYFLFLNKQAQPIASVPPTPMTSPNPTSALKSYDNTLFGFSFNYPVEYSLKDNLQTSAEPSSWTTRSTLTLENLSNKCSIMMMINPDGFGPNFPNYTFQGKYVEGEGFIINSKIPNSENLTPDLYNIIFSSEVKIGNVSGLWSSITCPDSVKNQSYADTLFAQILSTFKFTN